jgi:hypothetical protein
MMNAFTESQISTHSLCWPSYSRTDAPSSDGRSDALSQRQAEAIDDFFQNPFYMTLTLPVDRVDGFWVDGCIFRSWEDDGFSKSILDWMIGGLRCLRERMESEGSVSDILNEHLIVHVRNSKTQPLRV